MPLAGAYVADQYWGRYKTITYALGIDIIGHIILIISAIPPVITKPHSSLAALIVGILVIGFGTGGFKPNISPLIVEQLDVEHLRIRTLKTGERVIVDPAITINRVYNWFYWFINVGALVGQICMVYAEKYVGFYLSFLLPTCMLCLCPLIMWWGDATATSAARLRAPSFPWPSRPGPTRTGAAGTSTPTPPTSALTTAPSGRAPSPPRWRLARSPPG